MPNRYLQHPPTPTLPRRSLYNEIPRQPHDSLHGVLAHLIRVLETHYIAYVEVTAASVEFAYQHPVVGGRYGELEDEEVFEEDVQEDGAGEEVFCEAVGEGEAWGGGEEAGERTGVGCGGGRGGGDCGLRFGLGGGAADVAGQWDSKDAMLEARQPEEAPATKHHHRHDGLRRLQQIQRSADTAPTASHLKMLPPTHYT
ncbi:hypothetical protein LTR12_004917 [Friedmanniomyces endolithicus]|nr:hypothetical protein LTR12_004917 [Friedmanniomyces endolithicus]